MSLSHDQLFRAARHLSSAGEIIVTGTTVTLDGTLVTTSDLENAHAEAVVTDQWRALRVERDKRLKAVDERVRRHEDQVALGLTATDDIAALRQYAQDLRDLPANTLDPANPDWPVAP